MTMNYAITSIESAIGGASSDYVIITREDDSIEMFPADAENPRYKQFLVDIGEAEPELPETPVEEVPVEESPVEAPVEELVEETVDEPVTDQPIAE